MSLLQGIGAAQDEFAELIHGATKPALEMLHTDGGFVPYLVLLTTNDDLQFIYADNPCVMTGSASLLERLAATAATFEALAHAVVYDALTDSTNDIDANDAIALALKHANGTAQLALVPYETTGTIIAHDTEWLPVGDKPF